MQPSLPIPTDNIYKFCCLFGLTLIIATVFTYASVYTASLDRAVSYVEIVIPLEAKESRTKAEDETLKLNKKLIDATTANKKFALTALAALLGVGIGISGIGGLYWYKKIQRRDDKLAELQLRKLELEVASLSEILCALSRLINDTPRTDRRTAVRTALWQTPIRAAAFSSLW